MRANFRGTIIFELDESVVYSDIPSLPQNYLFVLLTKILCIASVRL